MSDGAGEHIEDHESVARFVISGRWLRGDGTIRQDAFIPPPGLQLSVTRHTDLAARELWQRGEAVARHRDKRLLGRADLSATTVRRIKPLDVEAAPLVENPQHAHITGWPADKPMQKTIAQQFAAACTFAPAPVSDQPHTA